MRLSKTRLLVSLGRSVCDAGGVVVMTEQQSRVPLREPALIWLDTPNPLYFYSLQISCFARHSLRGLFPFICGLFLLSLSLSLSLSLTLPLFVSPRCRWYFWLHGQREDGSKLKHINMERSDPHGHRRTDAWAVEQAEQMHVHYSVRRSRVMVMLRPRIFLPTKIQLIIVPFS